MSSCWSAWEKSFFLELSLGLSFLHKMQQQKRTQQKYTSAHLPLLPLKTLTNIIFLVVFSIHYLWMCNAYYLHFIILCVHEPTTGLRESFFWTCFSFLCMDKNNAWNNLRIYPFQQTDYPNNGYDGGLHAFWELLNVQCPSR